VGRPGGRRDGRNRIVNRAVVISRAARDLADVEAALSIEHRDVPRVRDGEVRLRTIYMSLDPATVTWVRLAAPYMPFGPGDVLKGTVAGVVEESRVDGFEPGDLVRAFATFQEVSVVPARGDVPEALAGGTNAVRHVAHDADTPLHMALSLYSHVGIAAIAGFREIGRPQPDETVLVSAAAGATGSIAAQVAKADGCRVIGIAGGPQKCAYLTDELGLDGAIDHHAGGVSAAIGRLAPGGVDIFFDNVGGPQLDDALENMAPGGRIIICGAVSQYGKAPEEQYRLRNHLQLLFRQSMMRGFFLSEFDDKLEHYMDELRRLHTAGEMRVREPHVVDGIEAVPAALMMLMQGGNRSKLMAQVAPLPAFAS
jgi:NADPH-dependent curcumin reductase